MSKIRECFVCGILLATSERQRVQVRDKRDKLRLAECCRECWFKVRGLASLRVVKNRKVYEVEVRRSQVELFEATAKKAIAGGGRGV